VAVLGILPMNALAFGLEPAAYFNVSADGIRQPFDWVVGVATMIFINQKMMALFSLLFGVGVGWNREELANVSNVPWAQRYNAMRETVAALRLLWTEHEVGYSGEFVNFAPSWVYPKPTQQPGPPVLVGCRGRIGMRHVAEYADGWCPLDVGFRDVRVGMERFRTAAESAGRDPDGIPISMYCYASPDAEKLELYRELGVERIVLAAPDGADRLARYVDRNQDLVDAFSD